MHSVALLFTFQSYHVVASLPPVSTPCCAGKLTVTDGTRSIIINPDTQTITTSTKRLNIGGTGNPHTTTVSSMPAAVDACRQTSLASSGLAVRQPLALSQESLCSWRTDSLGAQAEVGSVW